MVLIEVQHRQLSQLLSHTAEPQIPSCSYGVYLLQRKGQILLSLLCRVTLSNSTGLSCSYLRKPTQAWTSQVSLVPRFSLGKNSLPRNVRRAVWIWICCQCGHGGMKVSVDPCPYCSTPRCPNCETRRVHGRA
ncbi:hypothetical protein QL093DRAFT_2129619 [Fusarium oxysporum]|nr:hypothetical protein QL093DRAFT_2129619 [Fusarium oxysporum]